MSIFTDFMTKRQRAEAPRLDPVKENKKARVGSLEEAEKTIGALAQQRIGEIEELQESIINAEAEIEREQEAAAEAIEAGNYGANRAHVSARKEAEEALAAYHLRLDAIMNKSVIPKEDAVALIRSLDESFTKDVREAFQEAAELIQQLEELDEELAVKVNRYAHIARVLDRDILRGDELFFTDENGARRYVSYMLSNYAERGHALRALIYAMKRVPDEYAAVTGKTTRDRSAFGRIY